MKNITDFRNEMNYQLKSCGSKGAELLKSIAMKNLDLSIPVNYQSSSRNKGFPFYVTVLKINGKNAIVKTQGEQKVEFNCKTSSLFN